jgi:phosphatidylinositol 4-phosphatase
VTALKLPTLPSRPPPNKDKDFLLILRRGVMGKGKLLKIYDTRALFENQENGNCLLVSQGKDQEVREILVSDKNNFPELSSQCRQIYSFEAIFGFYDLLSGTYVALVSESEPYVNIGQASIRKAKKFLLIPLFRQDRSLSEEKQRDEDKYLELIYLGFKEHSFFFSYNYDLTLTQQQKAKLSSISGSSFSLSPHASKALNSPDLLWSRADERFFWNRNLVTDLISNHADGWIVPFVSAYIEFKYECVVESEKFSMLFISRRSKFRQGCRFTKRGIDLDGNVANFVETEQILIFPDGKITSYVQIRGSIPIKWSSIVTMKYEPVVTIDPNMKQSIDSMEKHFKELTNLYSDNQNKSSIICVNLIDTKKDQLKLGEAYREGISSLQSKASSIFHSNKSLIQYYWFDFHKECKKKGKWKNLTNLVSMVDESFQNQGYFCRLPSGEVSQWQIGVVRTNCMDNLDRTNVVQSLFARRSLMMQLGYHDLLVDKKYVLDAPWTSFEKVYKAIWANNANAISLGYAGTGALKVDFTKTGKRTIKGMINDGVNSVMRYYINNFKDGFKQDAIDMLLGNYRPSTLDPSPFQMRPGQESFEINIIKAFVLLMIIFSFLLLVGPVMYPLLTVLPWNKAKSEVIASDRSSLLKSVILAMVLNQGPDPNIDHLAFDLCLSFTLTILVVLYIIYKVVKKGSRIGEKMVIHPQLRPDSVKQSM